LIIESSHNHEKKEHINLSKVTNFKNIKIPQIYTKKFVLIQWWCDSFCTFCLTVKKRWRHFYRDVEDIIQEIIDFEVDWWKEVVLTGVNLSAWWLKTTNDIKSSRFAELLETILEKTDIERIRISSLWPEFIDDRCLEVFKQDRIYPHFHFSVQSWSSSVLKTMARHYDWVYIKDLLKKTKNIVRNDGIEVSIWADIIVWFPWETEEDFLDTYNLVRDTPITKLHAFPFSPHEMWESVPAWFFDKQIDEKTKQERVKKLLLLWEEIRADFINSQKWKTLKVLIESVKDWKWKGWTQNYIEANSDNFEIIDWIIKRNEIVVGKLI
jgi:MiaB/RimO family radical SAM methylthiotransferase